MDKTIKEEEGMKFLLNYKCGHTKEWDSKLPISDRTKEILVKHVSYLEEQPCPDCYGTTEWMDNNNGHRGNCLLTISSKDIAPCSCGWDIARDKVRKKLAQNKREREMDKTSLGDRMKNSYENRTRFYLPRRTYTIIRLDGKAFHTYTRGLNKPFDLEFNRDMENAAMNMFADIQGAQFAYIQSDEISILLTDFAKDGTDAWFDGNIQKIVSISASMMSVYFNQERNNRTERDRAVIIRDFKLGVRDNADYDPPNWAAQYPIFDSRVFTIPDRTEVENYFIWRQKDWNRNSVNMYARSFFSHKEMNGKSISDVHEMLHTKDVNWADLDPALKNGRIICRSSIAPTCSWAPTFTENRTFFESVIPRYDNATSELTKDKQS